MASYHFLLRTRTVFLTDSSKFGIVSFPTHLKSKGLMGGKILDLLAVPEAVQLLEALFHVPLLHASGLRSLANNKLSR